VDPEGLIRWRQFGSSVLGIIGNGVGAAVGGALLAAPEPTMGTKIIGGAVLGKSVAGWGLNWHNLVQSLTQPCDNYDAPSSAARAAASLVAPGNKDAQRLADAADLTLDFLSGRGRIYPYRGPHRLSKFTAPHSPSKYMVDPPWLIPSFISLQTAEVVVNNYELLQE